MKKYVSLNRNWINLENYGARFGTAGVLALALTACQFTQTASTQVGSSSSASTATINVATASLSVYKSVGGTLVYTDTSGKTSFSLQEGNTYIFKLQTSNLPSGTRVTLTTTDMSTPALTQTTQQLVSGNNTFSTPAVPGIYSYSFSVSSAVTTNFSAKTYQVSVQCPTDTFTQASLGSLGISVSTYDPGASANAFTFQVTNSGGTAGVMPSANGIGFNNNSYYLCQLDPTGTGILDTPPQDCSQPFTAPAGLDYATYTYTNYLGTRNMAVQVTDGCGYSYTVQVPHVNLPIPAGNPVAGGTPAPLPMPSNTLIYGQFGTTGTGDPRVDNAYFLGTNQMPASDSAPIVVTAKYNGADSTGHNGTFSIASNFKYNVSSAQTISIGITIGGLMDNFQAINPAQTGATPTPTPSGSPTAAPSPTVLTSSAYIAGMSYNADQYADVILSSPLTPQLSMSMTTCTPIFIDAQVVSFQPASCALTSATGDNNTANIEVWGEFICTLRSGNDGGVSVSFIGGFDGMGQMGDSCAQPAPGPPPPPAYPGPF